MRPRVPLLYFSTRYHYTHHTWMEWFVTASLQDHKKQDRNQSLISLCHLYLQQVGAKQVRNKRPPNVTQTLSWFSKTIMADGGKLDLGIPTQMSCDHVIIIFHEKDYNKMKPWEKRGLEICIIIVYCSKEGYTSHLFLFSSICIFALAIITHVCFIQYVYLHVAFVFILIVVNFHNSAFHISQNVGKADITGSGIFLRVKFQNWNLKRENYSSKSTPCINLFERCWVLFFLQHFHLLFPFLTVGNSHELVTIQTNYFKAAR